MKKKSIRKEVASLQSNVARQLSMLRIVVGLFTGMLMALTPVFSTATLAGTTHKDLNMNANWNSLSVPRMNDAYTKQTTTEGHPEKRTLIEYLAKKFSIKDLWNAFFHSGSGEDDSTKIEIDQEFTTVDEYIYEGDGEIVRVKVPVKNEQTNEQNIVVINEEIATESNNDGTEQFQNQDPFIENAESMMAAQLIPTCDPDFVYAMLDEDSNQTSITLKPSIKRNATTRNQHAIAAQLEEIANPTTGQDLILSTIINLPFSEIPESLDSLSGYQYTNDLFTTEFVSRQFLRRLYNPIRSSVTDSHNRDCNPCCQDWTSWVEAGGTHVCLNNSKNARGFNMKGYEITAGIQKLFACDWTLGVAGSYEKDNFHYKHGDGSGNSATWLGGIYGLYRPAHYYGLVDFAYAQSTNKMHRKIAIDTLNYSAYGKPDTSQFSFYGEVGVDFLFCNCLIQPFAGIQADCYRRKRIDETSNDGIGLVLHKHEHSSTSSRVGLHLTSYGFVDLFNVSLDLAWNTRLTGFNNKIHGHFAEFGNNFEIEGTKLNRNSIDYAVTVSTSFCNGWEIYLEGSGETWNKAQLYNILGGIKFNW